MKEATGELNMTVITVIAIAAIAGLFYAFIWPTIEDNINRSTWCANAIGCTGTGKDRKCTVITGNDTAGNPVYKDNYSCPEG